MTRSLGAYTLHEPIGAGGMAAVHFGRKVGVGGFARIVAIKRLRAELAADPNMAAMLLDEVRVTSRIQHPNVVPLLDVVLDGTELFLVLGYVHGESLVRLVRAVVDPVPLPIAVAIVADALRGLAAAHEARGADGQPLELVHRDLCPHNILVDVHGLAHVLDFGVAKAKNRLQETATGQIKGRLRYMAPEQVHGAATPRSDLFALGIVLWELLTGQDLFRRATDGETLAAVLGARIQRPAEIGIDLPEALETALMRALDRREDARFPSAAAMLSALEASATPASRDAVGAWVVARAGTALTERERSLAALERAADPVDEETQTERDAAAPTEVRRAGWRRRAIGIAIGATAIAIAASVLVVGRDRPRTSVALPRVTSSAASPPPSADPAPSAPSVTDPPPSRSTPRPALRPAPHVTPATSTKPSCDPPWFIDPAGVKVYKRDCFRR